MGRCRKTGDAISRQIGTGRDVRDRNARQRGSLILYDDKQREIDVDDPSIIDPQRESSMFSRKLGVRSGRKALSRAGSGLYLKSGVTLAGEKRHCVLLRPRRQCALEAASYYGEVVETVSMKRSQVGGMLLEELWKVV